MKHLLKIIILTLLILTSQLYSQERSSKSGVTMKCQTMIFNDDHIIVDLIIKNETKHDINLWDLSTGRNTKVVLSNNKIALLVLSPVFYRYLPSKSTIKAKSTIDISLKISDNWTNFEKINNFNPTSIFIYYDAGDHKNRWNGKLLTPIMDLSSSKKTYLYTPPTKRTKEDLKKLRGEEDIELFK